jgi:hypothetical protein
MIFENAMSGRWRGPNGVEVPEHRHVQAEAALVGPARDARTSSLRDPIRGEGALGVSSGVGYRSASPYTDDEEANTHLRPVAGRRLEDALRREHVPADVQRKDVAEAPHSCLRREVENTVEPGEVELRLREVEPPHVRGRERCPPSAGRRSSR